MDKYEYIKSGWLTVAQFAARKDVDRSTVSKWIKGGKIASVRSEDGVIFISPDELRKIIKAPSGYPKGRERK